jgi:hypothetical protein
VVGVVVGPGWLFDVGAAVDVGGGTVEEGAVLGWVVLASDVTWTVPLSPPSSAKKAPIPIATKPAAPASHHHRLSRIVEPPVS